MDTIRNALKEINHSKEVLKENTVANGWIINEEDDILDPFINQKKLDEGTEAVDWSDIYPCEILVCETTVQNIDDVPKWRPMLIMYKGGSADSPDVYGMQITTVPPASGFRSKFKYKLLDWRAMGLRKESYINYDHIVRNETDNISKVKGQGLSLRDAKGLLSALEMNYQDLVSIGYTNGFDRELLDDFMSYLEAIAKR